VDPVPDPLPFWGGGNSIASSGLEPATFRLITRCLNRLRYRVPPDHLHRLWKNVEIVLSSDLRFFSSRVPDKASKQETKLHVSGSVCRNGVLFVVILVSAFLVGATYYRQCDRHRRTKQRLTLTLVIRHLFPVSSKKTPWPESASELYRPSDHRLSAKLVPTFANRGFQCPLLHIKLSSNGVIFRPHLCSSGQSSWLLILRSGFDSRRYQIF
jgi:hypothetical protein